MAPYKSTVETKLIGGVVGRLMDHARSALAKPWSSAVLALARVYRVAARGRPSFARVARRLSFACVAARASARMACTARAAVLCVCVGARFAQLCGMTRLLRALSTRRQNMARIRLECG